jgi:hypothetical protein
MAADGYDGRAPENFFRLAPTLQALAARLVHGDDGRLGRAIPFPRNTTLRCCSSRDRCDISLHKKETCYFNLSPDL